MNPHEKKYRELEALHSELLVEVGRRSKAATEAYDALNKTPAGIRYHDLRRGTHEVQLRAYDVEEARDKAWLAWLESISIPRFPGDDGKDEPDGSPF